MTSEKHYTVKVKGHVHFTDSRDLDVEYEVPYTVKPEDLLEYINERVQKDNKSFEDELESPSASCESSFYDIQSYDHESYDQIYWEKGDEIMVDGEYLTPVEVTND
tara:strand:- start:567 stop:884 length:318 start_codon:yes stop_codon:yes gene_type:complete